jgi:hypothetical protein
MAASTRVEEAPMKKLKYFCTALLVACLLAIPAAAQNGEKGERNNNVSKQKGTARAEKVQAANKKGDKDKASKGSKNKGKHEGSEKKGRAKAKGHS